RARRRGSGLGGIRRRGAALWITSKPRTDLASFAVPPRGRLVPVRGRGPSLRLVRALAQRRCDRARPRPSLRRARPRARRRPLEHFGWDWPGDVDSGVSFLERQGVRHVGVLGLSPCGGRADIGCVTSPSQPLDGVVGKIAPRPLLLIQSNDPAERALAPVRARVDWRPGVLWHVDATHTKGLASHPAAYRGQGARALPASAASVAPELEQPLVADAEVVSQLVQDDAADLRGQLR